MYVGRQDVREVFEADPYKLSLLPKPPARRLPSRGMGPFLVGFARGCQEYDIALIELSSKATARDYKKANKL